VGIGRGDLKEEGGPLPSCQHTAFPCALFSTCLYGPCTNSSVSTIYSLPETIQHMEEENSHFHDRPQCGSALWHSCMLPTTHLCMPLGLFVRADLCLQDVCLGVPVPSHTPGLPAVQACQLLLRGGGIVSSLYHLRHLRRSIPTFSTSLGPCL